VDVPVVIAILFEDLLQEYKHGLQAVFITKISGSVYQGGQYRFFIG
jgi:hypothetical protein